MNKKVNVYRPILSYSGNETLTEVFLFFGLRADGTFLFMRPTGWWLAICTSKNQTFLASNYNILVMILQYDVILILERG